jgi:hypothetical protein
LTTAPTGGGARPCCSNSARVAGIAQRIGVDPARLAKLGQAARASPGAAALGRHHHLGVQQRLAEEFAVGQALRNAPDHDVQRAGAQLLQLGDMHFLVHAQLDARELPAETAQGLGQEQHDGQRHGPHVELALHLSAHLVDALGRVDEFLRHPARVLVQHAALGRGRHPLVGAHQQGRAELELELAQHLAQRRLRQAELARGTAHAAELDRQHQGLQCSQFHRGDRRPAASAPAALNATCSACRPVPDIEAMSPGRVTPPARPSPAARGHAKPMTVLAGAGPRRGTGTIEPSRRTQGLSPWVHTS